MPQAAHICSSLHFCTQPRTGSCAIISPAGCRSGVDLFVASVRDRHTADRRRGEVMSEYLLSVHSVEGQLEPSAAEMEEMYAATGVFNDELQAEGAWVFAGGLHPANTATVVKGQDGEVITTEGPFAESKEQLGGFWIVNSANMDEALAPPGRGR